MSEPIAPEKRTRSQLTLPDDILQQLSQRSPLKDARTALRNNTYTILEPIFHISTGNTGGTDDELLLTSRTPNVHFSTKRSASPLRDEYSLRSESPSGGRELKRFRRDLDAESGIALKTTPYVTPLNHIRSHSQPSLQLGKKVERSPTAEPQSSKPTSMSDTRSPTSFASRSKGRAQSVPLFATVPAVPHLDLRNPPPSPTRARSRSPFKFGENIKIMFEVNPVAKLDSKELPNMVIKSIEPPNGLPSLNLRTSTLPDVEETLLPPTASEVVMEINLPGHPSQQPPSTPPATERLLSTHLWSPLTPLPETPHPSKNLSDAEGRYTSIEREIERVEKTEEEREITTNNILHRPRYAGVDNGKSPLTHVPNSNRGGATSGTTVPPAFHATNTKRFTSLKNQSGPFPNVVKPSLGIVKRSAETPGDAFAVLMAQARLDKVGDKSKGVSKGKILHKKAAPSSAVNFNTSQSTRAKGIFQSTSMEPGNQGKTKPSLKAKMKPKQMPKARLIPVPIRDTTPPDSFENTSIPLNTPPLDIPAEHSPLVSSFNSSVIQDSKASADPIIRSPPIVHSALPLLGIPLPHPKAIGPKVVENIPIAGTSTRDAADAGVYLGNPLKPRTSPSHGSTTVTSKLPRAKRAPPPTTVKNATVTRRVSSRLKGKDATPINTVTHTAKTTKQTINRKRAPQIANTSTHFTSAPEVFPDTTASTSSLSDVPDSIPDNILPPGSPMKIDLPMRKDLKVQEHPFVQSGHSPTAKAALSRTPSKPKNKSKSESPSPSKLSRSTSMYSVRTTALSGTFTNYSSHSGQSSLSTLSNALEKLRMPPPARPNTSMGFNRIPGKADDTTPSPPHCTDDLPRDEFSRMVKHNTVLDPGTLRDSSSGQSVGAKNAELDGCKPAPMLNRIHSVVRLQSGTGPIMRSIGSKKLPGGRPIFGTGGRPFGAPGRAGALQKVSRKTSLPSVMASPVKSSYVMDSTSSKDEEIDRVPNSQSSLDQWTPINHMESGGNSGRESYIDTHRTSRRASLASQALSQSLSSLPLSGEHNAGTGSMGPPATLLGHSRIQVAISNNPTTSLPPFLGKNFGNEMLLKTKGAVKSANDTLGNPEEGVNGGLFSGRKQLDGDGVGSSNFNSDLLKVLQDCIIFVDVRTDDGDEAGSLFVEMLESVGARILTRVGQTCTHIVYKNGLVSTTTRYRLLRDPKPLVVGIAWVVECVEQRQRVDESKFAIDLDNINVAGVNRRRRSMLPKAIIREIDDMNTSNDREGDGDQSIDGPSSSIVMNDGLTPLEKARRRKGAQ